jgi:uncharacterized surface protein with fasciclin (FAS1) repeats
MRRLVTIVLMLLLFAATSITAQQAAPRTSMYDALSGQPEWSEFVAYLDAYAPDLVEQLQDTSNVWTVFAPLNGAFAALAERFAAGADDLLENTDLISSLVRYHIVPGAINPEYISLYSESSLTIGTMLPDRVIDSLYVADSEYQYVLNGVETTVEYTVAVTSGNIFTIDQVMIPLTADGEFAQTLDQVLAPADYDPNSRRLPTVIDALNDRGGFEYLVAYLLERETLLSRFEDGGYFTLLAAPDWAWEATLRDLYGYDIDELIFTEPAPENPFNLLDLMIAYGTLAGYYQPEQLRRLSAQSVFSPLMLAGGGLHIARADPRSGGYLIYFSIPFSGEAIAARNVMIYPIEGMVEVG